jgi:signal transduction histidine kinase
VGERSQISAEARHELLLLQLMALLRLLLFGQAAVALGFHWHAIEYPAVVVGLLALLAADNAVLVVVHLRRGVLNSRRLAALDVSLGMMALVAVMALLKRTANPVTDNVLYAYTVASLSLIGVVYRRLWVSLVAAALASTVYLSAVAWRFGVGLAASGNASTYWAWAAAGWFLADRVLRLSRGLDDARRVAAKREAELARERERSRHARELHAIKMAAALRELERERDRARLSRALHDHVLQTLEIVGRDGTIIDPMIRDHVAAEAAWLRDLVRGELDNSGGALSVALDRVVERQIRAGMRIELNTSGLSAGHLPEDTVEAIAGAVTELLANVRKHSGTKRAVVRAVSAADTVIVTVLDRGRGFDPIRVTNGVGLRESVIARIQDVDGRVVVTSEPDVGTHVEMTVPVPAGKYRKDVTCRDGMFSERMLR